MKNKSKITSLKEAIHKYVKDGEELICGNYTVALAMALTSEIVRQKKRHLTLYTQSGGIDVEYLIAGGCIDKVISTYVWMFAGTGSMARALKKKTIQLEDYTNFQYNARLQAGMYGFSFMQVLEGSIVTDIFKKRSFMSEDKFKIITCPYTGKTVLTVPAANPDVCIIHVQRADKYGNVQYWGSMGSVQAAALASKKIIVSCEEIVDHQVILSSPHNTIIPAYRVNAVVEAQFGAHPTEAIGYYYSDDVFYYLVGLFNTTDKTMKNFLDEWVYGCEDHQAYIQKYSEIFGIDKLNRLKAKPFYSSPVNYGSPFKSVWDNNGFHIGMKIKYEDVERLMEKEGLFHE